ncbi:GTPase [Telluria mixta]|uniref:GTPase n=1 Tax=Telluria mixta TaxID=34071 RepID=A0ABT2BWB0_9BURK|nr:GTPase [Telluria mixta]MCS0629405.1 GTPase [Telluria mixta]WEM97016.1 GTPase [Telluria mixta]
MHSNPGGGDDARTVLTLVTGPGAAAREAAIAAHLSDLHEDRTQAIILEGLASGSSPLDDLPSGQTVARIAPGCLCCTGNLVLRVTLNRLLRQRPRRIFIGVADSEHLDQLRSWLQSEPYDQLLRLTSDLKA